MKPRAQPHLATAYGKLSTPPPTIVAIKENTADKDDVCRDGDEKDVPRNSTWWRRSIMVGEACTAPPDMLLPIRGEPKAAGEGLRDFAFATRMSSRTTNALDPSG
mmetsp:Transcript_30111/g.70224  ORF Transcript_30111/g.70224 Transcript_30111/m.70224 type:complete len:105 (-) Transcript_30111:282-596(-)